MSVIRYTDTFVLLRNPKSKSANMNIMSTYNKDELWRRCSVGHIIIVGSKAMHCWRVRVCTTGNSQKTLQRSDSSLALIMASLRWSVCVCPTWFPTDVLTQPAMWVRVSSRINSPFPMTFFFRYWEPVATCFSRCNRYSRYLINFLFSTN